MAEGMDPRDQQMLMLAQVLAKSGAPIKDVMAIVGQRGSGKPNHDELFSRYAPDFAALDTLPENDFHRSIAKSVAEGAQIWDIEKAINEAVVAGGEGIDPSITAADYVAYAKGLRGQWADYNNNANSAENKSVLSQYGFTTTPEDQYSPEQLYQMNPKAAQGVFDYATAHPRTGTSYGQGSGVGPFDGQNNRGMMDSAMRQFMNRGAGNSVAAAPAALSPKDELTAAEAIYNVAFKKFNAAVDSGDLTAIETAGRTLDTAKKKVSGLKGAASDQRRGEVERQNTAQTFVDYSNSQLFGLKADVNDTKSRMTKNPTDAKSRQNWVNANQALAGYMAKHGTELKAAQDVVASKGAATEPVDDSKATSTGKAVRPKGFTPSSYMAPTWVDKSAEKLDTKVLGILARQANKKGMSPFNDELSQYALIQRLIKGK